METLLPSEIARLVLGYLEDQKCVEAAKVFLETSPHLQECRTVISNGRRFSTRVSGMSLVDVVEKFFVINATVQERLSKISDCDQVKHCGDLLEQLKFLVEETRGQRFVVNINVPSQASSQISNGSPVISSSCRKRRHSNSDRERCKRTKTGLDASQQPESPSAQVLSFDSVEATPLESLPGHTDTSDQSEFTAAVKRKKSNNQLGDNQDTQSLETNAVADKGCKEDSVKSSCPFERCNTATSTEELLTFSCAEVQTTPYDTPESESESNDEPIENLSLLTKELLNRTELQERIADNINKAILPTDTSLKDESLNDSVHGEGNTSVMIELNNAIKSIVEATETDPVFEKFLDEIIGPHTETDHTSLDEEIESARPKARCHNGSPREKQLSDIISNSISSPEPPTILTGAADVPLKHRLRSSSRQQNTRVEDEQRDQEKEYSALDDQNAAAVLSIINVANTVNSKSDKGTIEVPCLMETENEKKLPSFELPSNEEKCTAKSSSINNQRYDSNNVEMTVSSNDTESKTRKPFMKRPRPARPKRESESNVDNDTPDQDMVTVPTLIMCSKEEVSGILTKSTTISTTNSRFVPIVPKDILVPVTIEQTSEKLARETLFLKAVNVPHKIDPAPSVIPDNLQDVIIEETLEPRQKRKNIKVNKRKTTTVQNSMDSLTIGDSIVGPVASTANKLITGESITLYSNETSSKTLLDGSNMPTINVDDNVSLSDTGLSPYIKFSCGKGNQNQSLSDIDLTPIVQDPEVALPLEIILDDQSPSTSKTTDRNVINKRTPRSLLKSRSKNHRLSLSTPRRRSSSHVRALDFNTPTKITNVSNRSMSENENTNFSPKSMRLVKSVRRTSLFKSPPFTNTAMSTHKLKRNSPKICRPMRPPVATRGPMPKLIGGWDKYNGVGVIIGDASSQKTHVTSSVEDTTRSKSPKLAKNAWDADLRKALQTTVKVGCQRKKTESKDKTVSRKDKCNLRVPKARKQGNSKVSEEQKATTELKAKEGGKDTKVASLESEKRLSVAQHVNKSDDTRKDNALQACNETKNIPEQRNANKLVLEASQQTATSTPIVTNSNNDNSVVEKKTVKKYAQLKTLKTNLNKSNTEKKQSSGGNVISTDISQCSEFAKVSGDISRQMSLLIPELINLEETPRKFETSCGIPPTPRLLSPSSHTTPFVKISEDSSKLRCFINTPEFPTTPCIALTPKHSEETTSDAKKDAFNTCSPYYKPTSEKNESSEKLSKSKAANSLQNSSTLPSQVKQCIPQNIISSTNTFQTCVSAKLEITQFEVIKENLPKEDAVKELKISASSRDTTRFAKLKTDRVKDGLAEAICAITDKNKSLYNSEESSDSDTSSSSTSSSSSASSTSSSSSSSSSSSNKSNAGDSPEKVSPSKKCNRVSNQIYTDSSTDSARKDTDKNTAVPIIAENNCLELQVKTVDTVCTNRAEEGITALKESELSPLKVFSLTKNDEELKANATETPAKDDALLNEADISETPNSSKTGVESLTNLSSKIAAFISSEDQKLSEKYKDLFVKNSTAKKAKQNPKTVGIKRLKPNSSVSSKSDKCVKKKEENSKDEKLSSQLEEKRQRVIAKFRENPKSNVTYGKSQRGCAILKGRSSANSKRKNNQRNEDQASGRRKRKEKKDTEVSNNNNNTDTIAKHSSSDSVGKTFGTQNKDHPVASTSVNSHNERNCNEGIVCNETSTIKATKHADVGTKSDFDKVIIVEDVANNVEINATRKRSSDAFDAENKVSISNNTEEGISAKPEGSMHDSNEHSLDTRKPENDEQINVIVSQENKSEAINNEHNYNEKNVRKVKEYPTHGGKTSNIMKSKVDQVKRDLFSDEENDHKASNNMKNLPHQENEVIHKLRVPSSSKSSTENVDAENPKNLSRVLQSLQLIPTCKNDHTRVPEYRHEDDCGSSDLNATSTPNSVEYHFLYDDNAPTKKRRRRFSSHELEFQINIVLNDQGCEECVKVMTATDYEEIFNLPSKSRNKPVNRKSPVKNENCESSDKGFLSSLTMKNIQTKPLATSTPLEKTLTHKVKKGAVKTSVINEKNNEVQPDSKKKSKVDKAVRENDKDTHTGKISKRKLSETKESKQIEKRQYTTDPQKLLSNLDLDKFLTSVHGPA